jgi:UPF0716 protein FxsA
MALFVVVPLLELALLVWIGERVGILPTVALVVLTGILGAALARWQGVATWGRFRAAVEAGRMPHRELVEGLLVLVAGAVLLTPGLLTDAAGFALLVPAVRGRVGNWIADRLAQRVQLAGVAAAQSRPAAGGAVEVEYQVVENVALEENDNEEGGP